MSRKKWKARNRAKNSFETGKWAGQRMHMTKNKSIARSHHALWPNLSQRKDGSCCDVRVWRVKSIYNWTPQISCICPDGRSGHCPVMKLSPNRTPIPNLNMRVVRYPSNRIHMWENMERPRRIHHVGSNMANPSQITPNRLACHLPFLFSALSAPPPP